MRILFRKWVQGEILRLYVLTKLQLVYIFISDCPTLYIGRFTNLNLFFIIKIWKTVQKSVDTISWGTYHVEFTIRILNRGVICIEVYNTWKQAENGKRYILHNQWKISSWLFSTFSISTSCFILIIIIKTALISCYSSICGRDFSH